MYVQRVEKIQKATSAELIIITSVLLPELAYATDKEDSVYRHSLKKFEKRK